jgi:hypothetical protein
MLGSRFKVLLSDAGLSPEQAGKLLHVTPRTIRHWISGGMTLVAQCRHHLRNIKPC